MPIELPLIELKPYGHKSGTEATLRKIFAYDWVVFSSYNAVKFTFERLEEMGLDSRVFGAARVCAVGPKTAAALEKQGIRPDMIPEKYIAESMVEAFEEVGGLKGAAVLIPRAREAREVVPEGLEKMGARVDILPIYENVMPEPHPLALAVVKGGKIDVVTLASPSAAINYAELLKKEGLPVDMAPCAVIGPATQSKAEELGLPVVAVAEKYTVEGMVLALESYLANE